jgi:hypothetical protein
MKKNLFTFAITFVIASILFSSCSITKRHYTSGYYVSHNSGKQEPAKTQEQTAQKKSKPSLYTLPTISEGTQATDINKPAENGAITANNKQVAAKTNTTQYAKRTPAHLMTSPLKKNNFLITPKRAKVNAVVADDLAADAFSLFWIIILILLILWLVAVLTGGWGLGGFVYLLLVIALILLILWLLRII